MGDDECDEQADGHFKGLETQDLAFVHGKHREQHDDERGGDAQKRKL